MVQFIYTGGHRQDAPKYVKAFDAWFELNGTAMDITNQTYIAKLRGNPSFTELDDSLLIKTKTVEDVEVSDTIKSDVTIEATKTVEAIIVNKKGK